MPWWVPSLVGYMHWGSITGTDDLRGYFGYDGIDVRTALFAALVLELPTDCGFCRG